MSKDFANKLFGFFSIKFVYEQIFVDSWGEISNKWSHLIECKDKMEITKSNEI